MSHCLAERRETRGKQCTVTTGPSDRDISLQRPANDEDEGTQWRNNDVLGWEDILVLDDDANAEVEFTKGLMAGAFFSG